jgi:hypothetical protein
MMGTEPIRKNPPPVMPKMSRIEYTISTYMTIVPITINIHAASLVLDQSIMAKKDAMAPKINRLDMYIACPVSINLVSFFNREISSCDYHYFHT